MSTEDRRAPGATRIPFEAMVEVGGALGPSFEAQAINISEDGMALRTAYLPEVGQPITCRFDVGTGGSVLAAGEVLWTQDCGQGGEFGIRFTNLDPESVDALAQILGTAPQIVAQMPGSRIRLHIDGLGSPMRARVKGATGAEVTAFSELGFLQVGKQLELEDTQTGAKRPARIDRVEVEIDPESRVPQLVVAMRYDDEQARAEAEAALAATQRKESTPEPSVMDGEATPVNTPADHGLSSAQARLAEEESRKLRSAWARGAASVGPAFARFASRAKTTISLLAKRRGKSEGDSAPIPLRRVTAPPPGGPLHAAGRKVVRGEPLVDKGMHVDMSELAPSRFKMNRKKVAIAGAVAIAMTLGVIALKRPAPAAPLANAEPPEAAAAGNTPTPANATTLTSATTVAPTTTDTIAGSLGALPALGPDPSSTKELADGARLGGNYNNKEKKGGPNKVTPFGNGPVAHGNFLRLKMDGAIEKIEGASQPTGFTVVIPGRRSLEAAAPLAARDARIASIRVANESNGAELALTFKDGVPNYQVRAHGDTLEIALATPGGGAAKEEHDNKPGHAAHAMKKTPARKGHR
jgi:hypothetical protein